MIRRKWLAVAGVALVALLLVVGVVGCTGTGTLPSISQAPVRVNLGSQQEGIWVNGQGEVTVVPDVASLSLGISVQRPSVAEAQSLAAEAMNKVITALTDNNVDKKDIQTRQFSIQQVTRWDDKNQQEIVLGYRVTNTVGAKLRDIPKVGSVIDAVAVAGGDLVRINGISFSVDDPTAYYKEAREKAMADAAAKAKQLTELADVVLGKPTFISESTQSFYPGPVFKEALAGAPAAMPTPISPGEQTIVLNVQVVYIIK